MPVYCVTAYGSTSVEISANNEEAAKEKARNRGYFSDFDDIDHITVEMVST